MNKETQKKKARKGRSKEKVIRTPDGGKVRASVSTFKGGAIFVFDPNNQKF